MAILEGTEITSSKRRSQVYQATHIGEDTLPYMNRSFISFTYGDKKIEDFDLIATIDNNRLNKKGYAPFQDTVSEYENLDGQYFWGTHYKANQLNFTLSTDGIDQKTLDDFLYWFKAGTSRELILAEHPNRAIMARVSEPPTINMLPFKHEIETQIATEKVKITTTLYKGDINLSFVMDEPHWYAKTNILGRRVTDSSDRQRYEDSWTDITTGRTVNIFQSQDALKILYEDGIPLGSMIGTSMLLGNGAYANVDEVDESKIWSISEESTDDYITDGVGARIDGVITDSTVSEPTLRNGKYIFPNGTYVGIIAGAMVDASDNGIIVLGSETYAFFFYAGTAPSPATITFTMIPTVQNYITSPYNLHTTKHYNTITIESVNKQELRFTTPNVYTSFNKAIDVFQNIIDGSHSWEDVRTNIRDKVRHVRVREWAMKCIAYCENSQGSNPPANVPTSFKSKTCNLMSYFLAKKTLDENNQVQLLPVTFSFNAKTGESWGYFQYRLVTNQLPSSDSDWLTYGTIPSTLIKEDVGDMLRSNHIVIQDRNYPTDNGRVIGWTDGDLPSTHKYTHRFKHDVDAGLTNIQVLYKNMYL